MNWFESIGEVGSWFFSCVVSSVRKVWKLFAKLVRADVFDVLVEVEVEVFGVLFVTGVVMITSNANIEAHAVRCVAALAGAGLRGVS
ncbi:hypothetical protein GCM10008941_31670 [Rhizomicrobium palustre]